MHPYNKNISIRVDTKEFTIISASVHFLAAEQGVNIVKTILKGDAYHFEQIKGVWITQQFLLLTMLSCVRNLFHILSLCLKVNHISLIKTINR